MNNISLVAVITLHSAMASFAAYWLIRYDHPFLGFSAIILTILTLNVKKQQEDK